jgi:hypothetical protein
MVSDQQVKRLWRLAGQKWALEIAAAKAGWINAELHAALDDQLKLFKEKFGREPGPNDPVFFDPNADTP